MGSGLFTAQRTRAGGKDVPRGSAQEQRGHQEGPEGLASLGIVLAL